MITLPERPGALAPSIDPRTYGRVALDQAPRILGLGDRLSSSPTYGCFDRNYWHYGLLDLANARYQEVALYLTLLYEQDVETSYSGSAALREWAISSIRFWVSLQKRDGSFDEVYPNERSYVATAFSTFAVAEACRRLHYDGADEALCRSAKWLSDHENADVSNQVAGAIAALHTVFRVTGDQDSLAAAHRKRDLLLSLQAPEGWFPEYGGWDIGYLSIGLGYLSRYAALSDDIEAREASHRAAEFITEHTRDDGTYDNRCTSRGTQYIYPSGLALMGRTDVLSKYQNGLDQNRVVSPAWMDDRFCIPMAIDYLLASEAMTR